MPSPQANSVGPTWANGHTAGASIPLSRFFVATPSDSVSTINAALSRGVNLLLTPGVYNVDSPIKVKRADTVVAGLGMATLTASNGNSVLTTADVTGIDISGLIVDAGPVNSPILMQIGSKNGNNGVPHNQASDPTALQDVFFRVGGPHVGKATVALEVNRDDTILDDLWIWRADHGVPGSVGWTVNTADTGLVVNGNDVTATGLFVEHFQKYNVIWNGDGGQVVFFQNELPYDPPTQADYEHDGVLGYAAFKVGRHRPIVPGIRHGQLHLHQRRPGHPRVTCLRGPDHAGRPDARLAHDQPERSRHHRPRHQRHRWPGELRQPGRGQPSRQLPVT